MERSRSGESSGPWSRRGPAGVPEVGNEEEERGKVSVMHSCSVWPRASCTCVLSFITLEQMIQRMYTLAED
jgi:hypothetical protein